MKIPENLAVLIFVLLGFVLNPSMLAAQSDSTAPADVAAGKDQGILNATVLTIHGKIIAVDKAQKLVTVQVPNGAKYTLKVDNPNNLEAVSVGTGVTVRYYEVVSVRKKKPDESLPNLSVTSGIVTAKAGGAPGAVAEAHMKAVVSVVNVDKPDGTVTIKGRDGSLETVKAKNPSNLSQLKPGDDLVITASFATAISLEKEPAS